MAPITAGRPCRIVVTSLVVRPRLKLVGIGASQTITLGLQSMIFCSIHIAALAKIASWLAPTLAKRSDPCFGSPPGSPTAQPDTEARSRASTVVVILLA